MQNSKEISLNFATAIEAIESEMKKEKEQIDNILDSIITLSNLSKSDVSHLGDLYELINALKKKEKEYKELQEQYSSIILIEKIFIDNYKEQEKDSLFNYKRTFKTLHALKKLTEFENIKYKGNDGEINETDESIILINNMYDIYVTKLTENGLNIDKILAEKNNKLTIVSVYTNEYFKHRKFNDKNVKKVQKIIEDVKKELFNEFTIYKALNANDLVDIALTFEFFVKSVESKLGWELFRYNKSVKES